VEEIMRVMKFINVATALAVMLSFAIAQQAEPAQGGATIKHVPITHTPSNSGKDMYNNYCAVCHGKDGKGAGPAASALKTAPTDLSALAKNAGGKYPAAHVSVIIRGQATTTAHGSKDMPVWGPLFSSISQGHEAQVQQRITNVVEYVGTLQGK
jgi:mono/diheme cytochrome c family protein